MVSITNVTSGQASQYYRQDNYYLSSRGQWHGRGAEALGLTGEVRDEDFRALLSGQDPQGRFQVAEGGKERVRRAGIDLTFSAPKSVSILAEVARDERVREAHDRAVARTLQYVETLAQARQTEDGTTERVGTGNLVVAVFQHNTSRELDPQLHTHAVVLNITQRPDGQWRALSNEKIYSQKMFIGQFYRNELAANLRELGYSVQSDHRGLFEVRGVAQELLTEFSRRKEQIDSRVQELRQEFPNADESVLREMACLDSRKAKSHDLDIKTVRQSWKERAEQAGYDITRVRAEAERAGQEAGHRSMTAEEVVRMAAQIETESQSTFSREDILKTAGKLSIGEHRMGDLEQALRENREIVRLDRNVYTTREMQAIEARVVETIREGRGTTEAIQGKPELPSYLARGQRAAVEHILTTRDTFSVVQGDAGTGKTTMLSHVREQAEKAGWQVRGLTPTGKAAEELSRGAGIESRTIDSFLLEKNRIDDTNIREKINERFDEYHQQISSSSLSFQKKHEAIEKLEDRRAEVLDKLPVRDQRPTLYIIDEAGMVGSRKLHETLEKIRKEDPEAKVVFIGDEKQFQSIEAGKIFRDIQEKAGLEVQHLDEIQRQKDTGYRDITTDLSHRRVEQAIEKMESQGRVTEISDRDERLQAVARAYLADPDHSLVVTAQNRDRNELNQMIRSELKNEGRITGREYTFTVRESKNLSPEEKHFAQSYQVGDIVISNRASKDLLGRAGTEARVISVDENNHAIKVRTREKECVIDLKTHGQDLSVYTEKEQKFSLNDRVVFLKNDKGIKVKNGQTGVVKSIDSEGRATVELDTGDTKKINLRSQYNYVDHAYAVTVYKSQGQTVDRVIYHADTSRASRATNFNEVYVAATRGRHDLLIYTDSRENFREQAGMEQAKTSTLDYSRTTDRTPEIERGER